MEAANNYSGSDGAAFAELYLAYWHPLYGFARGRGHSPSEAEDVIQGFFTHLLSKQALSGLRREGGRFRSFLLRSLENFLTAEWRREQAQKRGSGQRPLSLDTEEGEVRFALDASGSETPESAFEKRWALTLLEHVAGLLHDEYARLNKSDVFLKLKGYIQPDRSGQLYSEVASQCGMSEGAVKVAIHRMRQRYGELLRNEIARTVSSPAEVDEELRYLISVVGR